MLGDLGYRGDTKGITKLDSKSKQYSYAMGCARDCHETVNCGMKNWTALKAFYRHDRHDHHYLFQSVAVIEQIKFNNGSPPFQIKNYIDLVHI